MLIYFSWYEKRAGPLLGEAPMKQHLSQFMCLLRWGAVEGLLWRPRDCRVQFNESSPRQRFRGKIAVRKASWQRGYWARYDGQHMFIGFRWCARPWTGFGHRQVSLSLCFAEVEGSKFGFQRLDEGHRKT